MGRFGHFLAQILLYSILRSANSQFVNPYEYPIHRTPGLLEDPALIQPYHARQLAKLDSLALGGGHHPGIYDYPPPSKARSFKRPILRLPTYTNIYNSHKIIHHGPIRQHHGGGHMGGHMGGGHLGGGHYGGHHTGHGNGGGGFKKWGKSRNRRHHHKRPRVYHHHHPYPYPGAPDGFSENYPVYAPHYYPYNPHSNHMYGQMPLGGTHHSPIPYYPNYPEFDPSYNGLDLPPMKRDKKRGKNTPPKFYDPPHPMHQYNQPQLHYQQPIYAPQQHYGPHPFAEPFIDDFKLMSIPPPHPLGKDLSKFPPKDEIVKDEYVPLPESEKFISNPSVFPTAGPDRTQQEYWVKEGSVKKEKSGAFPGFKKGPKGKVMRRVKKKRVLKKRPKVQQVSDLQDLQDLPIPQAFKSAGDPQDKAFDIPEEDPIKFAGYKTEKGVGKFYGKSPKKTTPKPNYNYEQYKQYAESSLSKHYQKPSFSEDDEDASNSWRPYYGPMATEPPRTGPLTTGTPKVTTPEPPKSELTGFSGFSASGTAEESPKIYSTLPEDLVNPPKVYSTLPKSITGYKADPNHERLPSITYDSLKNGDEEDLEDLDIESGRSLIKSEKKSKKKSKKARKNIEKS